ncbi:type II secretion system F family protein [Nocardioides pocheonensis]|uniref:Type II secretion system protein n=1 Tax=Nocardioides pocheonensis TaxID=661485 RepID=A0A3N0GR78_9ACTN|nr:type II secretion system F family protein [Nocardioides pocheonensis]RNM14678.1 type II secretion system protein [Nocardioides pocheonensis]
MSAATVAAALLAAGSAAFLAGPSYPTRRGGRPARQTPGLRPVVPPDERALLLRLRPVLVGLGFLGGWLFVGGLVGVVAGIAVSVLAWRVLGRAESPADRRRREELERDLPTAVHLLGACLAAGAATSVAFETVASALPGAVAEEFDGVQHRLALGADPASVWRDLAAHPQLRPLGRALARGQQSGASVRTAVEALAVELAAQSRSRTDALARSVEVRAAAPLGACFLPAFVLVGVVPMVVGVFSAMRFFG